MPQGGTRTPLSASFTWGQFGDGIFSPGLPLAPPQPEPVRLWVFRWASTRS
jgi:hypothetical protein